MKEDEQFNRAFGGHTGISNECREVIALIKDNSDQFDEVDVGDNELIIQRYDAYRFTDEAWKLLGRYIANNTYLKSVRLDGCNLTDEKMASLFRELVSSVSLERLELEDNNIGIDGVRSMIQFLQNSPKLSTLYFNQNNNVNFECFEVLVSALNGKSIRGLYFYNCNIMDISALDTYNLPYLEELNLGSNNIGRDGCITISNLLQQEDTRLSNLELDNIGINDEGVEILANSLKHNTKLHLFNLRNNVTITEVGCKAFLTLLTNVSSIENTYNSNHTLTELDLTYRGIKSDMIRHIDSAIQINKKNPTSRHTAGRAKVIKYQLNIQNRKDFARLQGIEYSSIGNLLADIEPILLPNILALIGNRHGQSELYTALIPTAPDLLSYIDRKALIDDEMAKNTAQIAALAQQMSILTAENDLLSKRREMIDIGDSKQQSAGGEGNSRKVGDKKRKIQH